MTSSKGTLQGQAKAALAALLALVLAACGGGEGRDCPPQARLKSLSGFCVPRYLSLKRDEVYGREGPGKDYPATWVYRLRGLPVQVVAETNDWRRICDPFGGATWVHRSMLDGRRTVLALGPDPAPILRQPRDGAPEAALLNPRSLASLGRCLGAFCKVKVDGVSGWASTGRLWGLDPAAQCH